MTRYYAEEGRRLGGAIRASARADIRSLVVSSPVGVVGAITLWNYPVDIYAWKLGPALAAGCSLVVKPPHETPLAVGMIAQCFADAGLPAAVLNDLPGTGLEAGAALAAHPDVRMITATASTAAGQSMMRAAAETMNRLTLEIDRTDAARVIANRRSRRRCGSACRHGRVGEFFLVDRAMRRSAACGEINGSESSRVAKSSSGIRCCRPTRECPPNDFTAYWDGARL